MDREIAQDVRTRRTMRRVITVVIALAAVAFFFAATVAWLRPSLRRNDLVFARVERGSIEATVQANGTVVPLVEQVVSSPVEARVLRIVHRAGDRVHAGDELLQLDTAAASLDAARLTERVAQKESEDTQLRLRLEDSVANTAAQLEQKRLDAQILQYTAQQKGKLGAEGLATQQEVLAAQAAAKKSDIEIRQLEEALVRARRSAAAQLSASSTDLGIARRERDESRRQLDLAMLRADRDGVVTWVVPDEGATVRRGDLVARIADLSAFKVVATISDIHASELAPGMRARVKLDEANVIGGAVSSVDPRIENGAMTFTVALDRASHPMLRNNLRVDVFTVTGHRAGVLSAQRGVLGRRGEDYAFVVRGDELVRVPAQFGLAGDDRIQIVSGLREGDLVVVSDMSDYKDVARVRLK
ncbi:MAG: HlyD family efflux transporter periplasmic adaptor subunit [Acidobacteria bacterium]|nr:HlyD family efflux transporter periplasmic adaptor subunit [Acidobacteriota bacterium]MBV9476345.1 HlyD family efflux transporter periplasmic adaptor subunit [Acidobacteriota bacterium]